MTGLVFDYTRLDTEGPCAVYLRISSWGNVYFVDLDEYLGTLESATDILTSGYIMVE